MGEVIVGTGGGRVVVSKGAIVYKEELTIASGDAPPPIPTTRTAGRGVVVEGGGGVVITLGGGVVI